MYCSACGLLLPHAAPVQCPACGLRHWHTPLPCADALIVQEGRLFLLQRERAPWAGSWDLPGGFCDAGEHPIATITRTVAEETGLLVRVTGYLGAWPSIFPRAAGRAEQVATLNLVYHAELREGTTLQPDRTSVRDVGWFTIDVLPHDLAFPDYLGPMLNAWREAMRAGRVVTALPDEPLT